MIGAAIPLPADIGLAWTVGVVAPESDFSGEIVRSRRTAIGLAAAALVLAVLVASFLATRIARPLERIAGEMAEAGQMHLEARPARPSRFLEVERMDDALARLRSGLRSFSRFVPTDLVRRVLSSGHEAVLFADTRRCTVFFSDIAGFTRLAERTPPAELVRILGAYLDETTRVIDHERGTIDKFIGDAIMAFWGAPEGAPDQAVRACVAALRIQARLAYLRGQGLAWAKLLPTRVGIATGDVVVGNVGATTRLNYTALGDTVNVASRLEGLNKRYGTKILVSEATYEAAKHAVVARPVDLVALTGREGALRVYEPLAGAADATPAVREIARLYEEGLALYLRRDFAGAAIRYARASEIDPDDPTSRILWGRARALAASPPPGDWSGVSSTTEK
jgi:adenylate cyclase